MGTGIWAIILWGLGTFLIFPNFQRSYVLSRLGTREATPIFHILSNNRTSLHLCSKQNFLNDQKVSKCYEAYCLEYFLLLFMFLLTAKLVKDSHIYPTILFIFLQNVLKQTCSSFNSKLEPQWKDSKSRYEVKQILGIYLPLNRSKFRLKQCGRSQSYQTCHGN